MDWASLSLAAVAASTSGINLYATVLVLGLLQRLNWLQLPGDWALLGESWILLLATALFAVEFFADKIPLVDSLWDGIHTFIRIPAGGLLMATAFSELDAGTQVAIGLLGGSLAFTTHGAKATARLAANTSPEPFSNIALSFVENAVTLALLGLAATHPLLAAFALAVVLLICIAIMVLLFKFTRRVFTRLRGWFGGPRSEVQGPRSSSQTTLSP